MVKAFVVTLLIFVLPSILLDKGHADTSEALLQQAALARENGNYKAALKLYQRAPRTGNAEAMNAIGIMNYRGMGTPADERQAFFWIKRSAEQGFQRPNIIWAYFRRKDFG